MNPGNVGTPVHGEIVNVHCLNSC